MLEGQHLFNESAFDDKDLICILISKNFYIVSKYWENNEFTKMEGYDFFVLEIFKYD